MKKQTILLITVPLLILSFIIFVFLYERYIQSREQHEIDKYAEIIAISLWNMEPTGPFKYLEQACIKHKYQNLSITDIDGEQFIDISTEFRRPVDRFLVSLKLVRPSKIKSSIIYHDRTIGEITAVWYSFSIYIYSYTILLILLSLMVLWFFLSAVEKSRDLEIRANFLKRMFGRYLSNEVMETLIDNPETLGLEGDKRYVTIMMTDLRGFTPISERLEPEQVLKLLNSYFEVMVDVILKYDGTIDEMIGDALLVLFGAPQHMIDSSQRAVACAIDMQNAMFEVNERNRAMGLPNLEMGIGLNETEVIVGSIGSVKRSKFGVVGSGVNMTGRIESYTVGGQILVSESVYKQAGDVLQVQDRISIFPKGTEEKLIVYDVGGIGGQYNLTLKHERQALHDLIRDIPINCRTIEGKHEGDTEFKGMIIGLSPRSAEIILQINVNILTNLKLNLTNVSEELQSKIFYGKIIQKQNNDLKSYEVKFTALPSEVDSYFQSALYQVPSTEEG